MKRSARKRRNLIGAINDEISANQWIKSSLQLSLNPPFATGINWRLRKITECGTVADKDVYSSHNLSLSSKGSRRYRRSFFNGDVKTNNRYTNEILNNILGKVNDIRDNCPILRFI